MDVFDESYYTKLCYEPGDHMGQIDLSTVGIYLEVEDNGRLIIRYAESSMMDDTYFRVFFDVRDGVKYLGCRFVME